MELAAVTVHVAEVIEVAGAPAVAALALLLGPRIGNAYQHGRFLAEQRLAAALALVSAVQGFVAALSDGASESYRGSMLAGVQELAACESRVLLVSSKRVGGAAAGVVKAASAALAAQGLSEDERSKQLGGLIDANQHFVNMAHAETLGKRAK